MHQTTVRFDSQMWRRIDEESARAGVSAAQYIRDATLIRLTQVTPPAAAAPSNVTASNRMADSLRRTAASAISSATTVGMDSRAVWAQARQARERARSLRAASHRLAESRALRPWAGSHWVEPVDG